MVKSEKVGTVSFAEQLRTSHKVKMACASLFSEARGLNKTEREAFQSDGVIPEGLAEVFEVELDFTGIDLCPGGEVNKAAIDQLARQRLEECFAEYEQFSEEMRERYVEAMRLRVIYGLSQGIPRGGRVPVKRILEDADGASTYFIEQGTSGSVDSLTLEKLRALRYDEFKKYLKEHGKSLSSGLHVIQSNTPSAQGPVFFLKRSFRKPHSVDLANIDRALNFFKPGQIVNFSGISIEQRRECRMRALRRGCRVQFDGEEEFLSKIMKQAALDEAQATNHLPSYPVNAGYLVQALFNESKQAQRINESFLSINFKELFGPNGLFNTNSARVKAIGEVMDASIDPKRQKQGLEAAFEAMSPEDRGEVMKRLLSNSKTCAQRAQTLLDAGIAIDEELLKTSLQQTIKGMESVSDRVEMVVAILASDSLPANKKQVLELTLEAMGAEGRKAVMEQLLSDKETCIPRAQALLDTGIAIDKELLKTSLQQTVKGMESVSDRVEMVAAILESDSLPVNTKQMLELTLEAMGAEGRKAVMEQFLSDEKTCAPRLKSLLQNGIELSNLELEKGVGLLLDPLISMAPAIWKGEDRDYGAVLKQQIQLVEELLASARNEEDRQRILATSFTLLERVPDMVEDADMAAITRGEVKKEMVEQLLANEVNHPQILRDLLLTTEMEDSLLDRELERLLEPAEGAPELEPAEQAARLINLLSGADEAKKREVLSRVFSRMNDTAEEALRNSLSETEGFLPDTERPRAGSTPQP